MKSSNPYRSWSVRPEELLIESARERIAAKAAYEYACAQTVHPPSFSPTRVGQTPVRAVLVTVMARVGHLLAPRRRATGPPVPTRNQANSPGPGPRPAGGLWSFNRDLACSRRTHTGMAIE